MVGKKSGVQIAIDVTIEITQKLSSHLPKDVRKKLVQDIFDDQLKLYTNFNRLQRRKTRNHLKKALLDYESK